MTVNENIPGLSATIRRNAQNQIIGFTLSGTPSAGGAYQVNVSAVNQGGTTSHSFDVTISIPVLAITSADFTRAGSASTSGFTLTVNNALANVAGLSAGAVSVSWGTALTVTASISGRNVSVQVGAEFSLNAPGSTLVMRVPITSTTPNTLSQNLEIRVLFT